MHGGWTEHDRKVEALGKAMDVAGMDFELAEYVMDAAEVIGHRDGCEAALAALDAAEAVWMQAENAYWDAVITGS